MSSDKKDSDFDMNQTMAYNPASQASANEKNIDQTRAFNASENEKKDIDQTMVYNPASHANVNGNNIDQTRAFNAGENEKKDMDQTMVFNPSSHDSGKGMFAMDQTVIFNPAVQDSAGGMFTMDQTMPFNPSSRDSAGGMLAMDQTLPFNPSSHVSESEPFDMEQTIAFKSSTFATGSEISEAEQKKSIKESAQKNQGQGVDFSQTMGFNDPTHSMREARYRQENKSTHFKPGTKLDTGVYKPANQMSGPMADTMVLRAEQAKKEVEFQKAKTAIHREILNAMDLGRVSEMTDERLITHIQRIAQKVLNARKEEFKEIDTERLVAELVAESFGLGPLEVFMKDPEITDILVNGPEEVYIEKHGILHATNVKFADTTHLMQIIQRIVAKVGRRVDEQTPMVDARLADGSRVNAIIKPLAINGPILSIRRFGNTPLAIEDLIAFGSIPQPIVQLLRAAVEGKINIMISGGTGSGKTTLLNAVSKFIPDGERLVTVEDSAELKLQRPHVVSLESRNANNEGKGAVTLRDLVRNSLRMRPDRIILGEVRGPEALDMLQAMNTGHEGSLTTIHANGIRDSLSRLEVMVSMTGLEIPVSVIRRYVSSAITLVVQLSRLRGGVRRVMSVAEITGFEDEGYKLNELFYFKQRGADLGGRAVGNFFATGNKPKFLERLDDQGIVVPEDLFIARQF